MHALQVTKALVAGYSGIVVGLAMVEDAANEELVCRALADEPGKLEGVLAAMDDFAKIHDIGEGGGQGRGEGGAGAGDVEVSGGEEEATQVDGVEVGGGGVEAEVEVEAGRRRGTAKAIRAMVERVRAR